jgi:hypothetical protein
MMCLAVGLAVACLGGFHCYLVLTGQTTIEFHANWVNRSRAKRLGQKWRNPYDLGWHRNFQQVYGYRRSVFWAIFLPSTRQPDFLPLPMLGEKGKRKHLRKIKKKQKKTWDPTLPVHSSSSSREGDTTIPDSTTVPLIQSTFQDGDMV